MVLAPFHAARTQLGRSLKLLVLGGTSFLGPAIVNAAMAGHEVTLFNSGRTNPRLFPELELIKGDRSPHAPVLTGLQRTRAWDAVIDVWPFDPHVVAATARLLQDRVARYVFVSTTVVYKNLVVPRAAESDLLFDDMTDASAWYEYDKAQCERVLQTLYGARHAVCRSHITNGYRNANDTLRMWAVRTNRGGEVLAPGRGDDPVQFTDVKDVGQFVVRMADHGLSGAYNVAGPAAGTVTFRTFERVNAACGNRATLTWVNEDFLEEQRILAFSDLAMWIPVRTARRPGVMQVSRAKALSAGLTFRPLGATTEDELNWFREHMAPDYESGAGSSNKGFSMERERALLSAWHRTRPESDLGRPQTRS